MKGVSPWGNKAAIFWPSLTIIVLSDIVTKYLAHTLIVPYRPPRSQKRELSIRFDRRTHIGTSAR